MLYLIELAAVVNENSEQNFGEITMWKNTIKKAPSMKDAHGLREMLLKGIVIAKAHGTQHDNFREIHKHLESALKEFDDIYDEEWNGMFDMVGVGTVDYTQPNNNLSVGGPNDPNHRDMGNRYEQSS